MAKPEIIKKLKYVLNEDIDNECQVIYILSRIRKILELDNKKKDYKYLNFYCDWSLHPLIDKTKRIESELIQFINGDDKGFLNFDYLKNEIKDFLETNKLNTQIIDNPEKYYSFVNLYLDVVSDTPLKLILSNKTLKIKIKKPEIPFPDYGFTVEFYVESEFD